MKIETIISKGNESDFDSNTYPKSGFYIISYEKDIKSFAIVNKKVNIVYILVYDIEKNKDYYQSWLEIFKGFPKEDTEKREENKNNISEDLYLKTMLTLTKPELVKGYIFNKEDN